MLVELLSNGQAILAGTIFQSWILFCIAFKSRQPRFSLLCTVILLITDCFPCSAPPTTSIQLPAYSIMATFQSFLPDSGPTYHHSRHLRQGQRRRHHHHTYNYSSTPSYNYFLKYSTKMRRLRPLPTAPTSFYSDENRTALIPLPLLDGKSAGEEDFLRFHQAKERKKVPEHVLSVPLASVIKATPAVWKLYNRCSGGFVQTFMGFANARGRMEDVCWTNFLVHSLQNGVIMLEQFKSHRFLCFNRRRRLAVRKLEYNEVKCHFREHQTNSGYTMLESAWTAGLFLGFNRKGRYQDPSQFNSTKLHKCFQYSKLEARKPGGMEAPLNCTTTHTTNKLEVEKENGLHSPRSPHKREQELIYEVARNSILTRVEI